MKKLFSSILNNIYLFILVTAPIYFIALYKVIILHELTYIRFKLEGEILNLSFLIPFILISSFFNKKIFKTILIISTILIAVTVLIELETLLFLERYFATDVMYDLLATNKKESAEFLHTIFSIKMILKQVALIVPYLVYCGIAIYFLTKIKFPTKRYFKFTSLILLLIFPLYHTANHKRTVKHILTQNTLMFIMNGLSDGKLLQSNSKNISTDYTAVANNTHIKKLVVFILGESQTRNHLGLYGYHRNTTPRLHKLQDNKQLFVFNDVITSEPATAISMKNIFLTQGYETRPNINIMAMFNKAGFKNYYIENQYVKFPTTNTVFTSKKKRDTNVWFYDFQIITNTLKYLSNRYIAPNAEYDKAILPNIDKILKKKDDNIFMLIHLQGSHFHYKNRYPKNFPHYTKPLKILEEMDKKGYSQFGSRVLSVNEYDTSTRYTDYVLDEMIKKISTMENHEQYEISIVYMPDHGEATSRTGNGSHVGHGTNVDKDIYEIPLILWTNPTFNNHNPTIIENAKTNLNAPYMTDQIGFSLFQLAGISIFNKSRPVDTLSKSIFSNSLNTNRIRKIGFRAGAPEGIDYDTVLKPQKDLYK